MKAPIDMLPRNPSDFPSMMAKWFYKKKKKQENTSENTPPSEISISQNSFQKTNMGLVMILAFYYTLTATFKWDVKEFPLIPQRPWAPSSKCQNNKLR